ncbi:vasopressin V1a receptor-like [Cylas formicarius]|uniref:vasopressin V1a receptor-like n=1 Tax=Cylas formicarius TaxID=197179 RepID=UPI0029587E52|nr:vasopressin V1a receptor-like [Cylas formicarius]
MRNMDRDEKLAQAEIATLVVIFVATVLGNGLVLLALWTRTRSYGPKKLSRMLFFILHLSMADLIVAFFSVLPQLCWEITYRFKGGCFLCKVVKYCQTLGPYLSPYILMATAVDRYQAICHPLTYWAWSSKRSSAMVYAAWIASLLCCVPQLTIFSYIEVEPGVYDCWATFATTWGEKAYVIWYATSVFIVPLTVLIYTYGCICREIWRCTDSKMSPRHSNELKGAGLPLISRAKINTVKQTVAVIALYILCSTPFIMAQLWATIDPTSSFLEGPVFTILGLLYSLNSCANPWIYLSFNKELSKLLLNHYLCRHKDDYVEASDGPRLSNSSGEQITTVRNSQPSLGKFQDDY